MTYSWKEGAIKRKEIQIGQKDIRPVTGANKKKVKKKDKPWQVVVTFMWNHYPEIPTSFVHYFLHEEDAIKFARKTEGKYSRTQLIGPSNENT
jgi:hypothetical protein